MKPISKRILTVILAMMILSLFVGEVQATDYDANKDSLIVSIESADYLDLDGDQIEDDILTEFTITVPKGNWEFVRTFVYCELVLPSGYYFNCLFLMIGSYNSVTLTLGWYNTAIESGWYTFEVYAWGSGPDAPDLGYDSVIFDPPTEEIPGPPSINIIQIVVE
ncbi:MAG: hypothetical protein E4H14_16425 [Candidatus Thorarchaeota archaeon]|nr:MAG: hypothetical protein E4H14_16425 [Candidatus Thorarchaeota archaeon]